MSIRDELAAKEGAPYHETAHARTVAFKNGWDASLEKVMAILKENYEASKNLTDFDRVRPAQEIIVETYEDLIDIINHQLNK